MKMNVAFCLQIPRYGSRFLGICFSSSHLPMEMYGDLEINYVLDWEVKLYVYLSFLLRW